MENDRTFPSASIPEGSSKVISRYWPDLNVQFDGFLNWNAVMPAQEFGHSDWRSLVVDISSSSRVYLPESAFQQVGGE